MELEFRQRAEKYLGSRSTIQQKLGSGQEGYVWETSRGSALKVFERETNYKREIDCYRILKKHSISQIEGFHIPQLIGDCEQALVIEMSIVTSPYILDFGKAYTHPPDYPDDAIAEYESRCADDFGKHWQRVQAAIYELEQYGIWYVDANLRNISCAALP